MPSGALLCELVQPQQLVLHLLARRALRRQLHLRGRQRRAHNSQLRSSLERWGSPQADCISQKQAMHGAKQASKAADPANPRHAAAWGQMRRAWLLSADAAAPLAPRDASAVSAAAARLRSASSSAPSRARSSLAC